MPGATIDNPNLPHHARSDELRAAWIALGVGIVLTATKFIAYLLTSSTAIFSDALESIVNVVAGGVMLFAIHTAHAPADREHPYGHGKVEFLAAGAEGAMILLAAVVILFRAIEQLFAGPQVANLGAGVALVFAALAVNGVVGGWLLRKGRRSGSIALEADGKHLLSDAVTSAGVLVALIAVRFTGWAWIDPLAAVLVAAFITFMGVRLLRRSAAGLMDEQDPRDDELIRRILQSHIGESASEPRVRGFHKLRHRHSGRYHWIDFHLLVPPQWSVEQGHRAASVIEHEIEQAIGYADATAHVEPAQEQSA